MNNEVANNIWAGIRRILRPNQRRTVALCILENLSGDTEDICPLLFADANPVTQRCAHSCEYDVCTNKVTWVGKYKDHHDTVCVCEDHVIQIENPEPI